MDDVDQNYLFSETVTNVAAYALQRHLSLLASARQQWVWLEEDESFQERCNCGSSWNLLVENGADVFDNEAMKTWNSGEEDGFQ